MDSKRYQTVGQVIKKVRVRYGYGGVACEVTIEFKGARPAISLFDSDARMFLMTIQHPAIPVRVRVSEVSHVS